MRDRLEKFIKTEGLTPTRLAEIMGVQPSSISHLLGGRNKPSYDFLEKMLLRFPKINPDWLILGKGTMYRSNSPTPVEESDLQQKSFYLSANNEIISTTGSLFEEKTRPSFSAKEELHLSDPDSQENKPAENCIFESIIEQVPKKVENEIIEKSSIDIKKVREIERIVIFYTDNSFESFNPKMTDSNNL